MTTLDNHKKIVLDFIESKITVDTSEKDFDINIINYLLKLPYDMLIAICNHSRKLNYFMHSDPRMLSAIAEKLKKSRYIYVPIQSMDAEEKHDVFDHYLAALIIQSYFMNLSVARESAKVKQHGVYMLDRACKLGLYNALIIRCKLAIKNTMTPSLSIVNKQRIIQSLTVDISRLANLYWSIGYLQAGSLWQELGDYFLNKEDSNEEQKNYGMALHDKAVENFLCAFLLRHHTSSISIMDSLTQGKGLAGLSCEENLHFETWDEFQSMIYNWVNEIQYEKMLYLAEKEVASVLKL